MAHYPSLTIQLLWRCHIRLTGAGKESSREIPRDHVDSEGGFGGQGVAVSRASNLHRGHILERGYYTYGGRVAAASA
jgi:hypothetical protein